MFKSATCHRESAVQDFMARHASKITGLLHGFDRLPFRGILSRLNFAGGVAAFLAGQGVLLNGFEIFVEHVTTIVRDAATTATMIRLGQRIHHFESSSTSKEQVALEILKDKPIDTSVVCVLSSVESCNTWQVFRTHEAKTQKRLRKLTKFLFIRSAICVPTPANATVRRARTW